MNNLKQDLQEILKGTPWGLKDRLEDFIAKLNDDSYKHKGKRTIPQNNAVHLACDMLANTLNDAGLDMKTVLKPEVAISWSMITVKEYLFKPIMKAKTTKKSTTELNKIGEIDEIWDTLLRHLGEKFHIEYLPFPSKTKIDEKTDAMAMAQEVPYPENDTGITAF